MSAGAAGRGAGRRAGAGRALWAIVAVALVARLGVFLRYYGSWHTTDSHDYLRMADAILDGRPISYFPNGYPLLIAAVQACVGGGLLPLALVLLNVALSTGVVALAYRLGELVSGRTSVAILSGALVALYPNQLNFTRQILSEVPATFFLLFAMCLLLSGRAFTSGLLFAAAAAIRPTLLPAALLCLAAAALTLGPSRAVVVRGLAGLAAGLAFFAALEWGGVVAPPNNLEMNLLIAVGADRSLISTMGLADVARVYLGFAWENPSLFLLQRLRSLWELWGPWPEAGDPPRPAVWRALIGVRTLLLVVGAGYAVAAWRENWRLLVPLAPVAAITAVHFFFFSAVRFSFPAEPALCVLVACAAVRFVEARVPSSGDVS